MSTFLSCLDDRVLLFDGGMGTQLQGFNLPLADYQGLENCSEILNLTRPDVVGAIHRRYFEAGADVVETNSFGGAPWVLAEFGLQDQTEEINRASAQLAREAALEFSSEARPRFVAGSIGPGTRLPTLGHIHWDEMYPGYRQQVRGLVLGGCDVLLVETCQDLLQTKCALAAIFDELKAMGLKIPVMAQVTMETTGTMLLGSDIAAAATVLEQYPIDVIGLNCATGPLEMASHIAYLGRHAQRRISVLPNAGLPQLVDGKTYYPLSPNELADWHVRFIQEDGVSLVGGCCGTTPDHIRAASAKVLHLRPKRRSPEFIPGASSLYSPVAFRQQADIFAIGERTNANGSRQFKRLLDAQDWDGMVTMGKEQVKGGSHAIDVCTAFVGRPEIKDMDELVKRLVGSVQAPLVIDSTEVPVVEAALKRVGGKAIVNSINLEDGEDKLDKLCVLCRRFGAAVIALTIDEVGMAKLPEQKLAVAERLYDLAVNRHGLQPDDILFDPLTFTIATGNEDDRKLGLWTLQGIKLISERFPRCGIVLGLSNISFGLNPPARHALNSVFLHHAREHGMTAAIVHAEKITPLYKLEPEVKQVCEDLIYDRRSEGYDPLHRLLAIFADRKEAKVEKKRADTVEQQLKDRIVEGDRTGLEADLDEALRVYPALTIINDLLLDGMRVVGELFGSGQMQLPFVLQSAETMKKAVAYLQPFMDKVAGPPKGTMVLATVRGDVHDIGKNLVDIILSNNGYNVINIGIKQPIDQILKAAGEHNADAIGMSGLLVKSTVIMKENLEEMRRLGWTKPVVLGGAALTRAYVEEDCSHTYGRRVSYAKDAFAGLYFMDKLAAFDDTLPDVSGDTSGEPSGSQPVVTARAERPIPYDERDAEAVEAVSPPTPPFVGSRVLDVPVKALAPWINEDILFKFQWGFLRKKMSLEEHATQLRTVARPILLELLDRCAREEILRPQAAYGYFRARNDGDAVVLTDHNLRLAFPRQRNGGRCLADFVGQDDVIALQVVTVGHRATEVCRDYFAANRYTEYLYLHGLSVELTEALAEFVHKQIRAELGISANDSREIGDLFHKKYQGCRYAYGYPACPEMADQQHLLKLLGADRIGIKMDDDEQLHPEQSTAAIVIHHPQARYFRV